MFERFTERARQVVVLAQEEARTLRHECIGTEHILLGLLREQEGQAARVLQSLDITVERVRAQVVRMVGSGEEPTTGQIPFTAGGKRVLESSLDQALNLGHNYVGTAHLLLAAVHKPEGVVAQVLVALDVDADEVRGEVMRLLAGPEAEISRRPLPRPRLDGPGAPLNQPEGEVDFGWRGRSIMLAALGAAVLARSAFSPDRTGTREPLEMQLLAHLTLETGTELASQPGEGIESLSGALACDSDELRDFVRALIEERLVVYPEDDNRVAITTEGVAQITDWLRRTASLFGGWPPDRPEVDDATG